MADEKTTPTPKVGRTDTMHSTPDTPDRSAEGDDDSRLAARDKESGAPSHGGSVGAERPGKTTITAERTTPKPGEPESLGTLVTDIPDLNEQETSDEEVNPAQEGPAGVARQPNESAEEAGERIKKESAEAEKAAKAEEKDREKAKSK